MRDLVHDGHRGRVLHLGRLLRRRAPPRVEQLGKVDEREALRRPAAAGKVEDDVGLHGREERIARRRGAVVEEVGLVDTAVFRLSRRFSYDPVNEQYTMSERV